MTDQERSAEFSDGEAGEPTKRCQHQALDEPLAAETQTRRAKGETKAHLVPAGGGACQHQVGDVRAGDEQDRCDDHHDNRERLFETFAQSTRRRDTVLGDDAVSGDDAAAGT